MTNNQPTPAKRITDNFDKIKAEGDIRFKKITRILRAAITESVNELRAGTAAVSPATKEFRDSIAQRIKETSQETLEEAQKVWASRTKEESFQDWFRAEIQAVTNAMRDTLKKDSDKDAGKLSTPPENYLD
ncbi:MAG: hypothetical protein AAGI69_05345 [Cyanobacteria bacterium P01_H01_bin.21]